MYKLATMFGDRPFNDINGANEAGYKSILFTGVKKRNFDGYKPTIKIEN